MTKAPLLVVNNPAPAHWHDVIVGVDFSDCARNAINTGAALAPQVSMTPINAYQLPFKQLTQRADPDGSINKRERIAAESKLAEDMKVFLERVDNKTLRAKSAFIEGGAAPVQIENAR